MRNHGCASQPVEADHCQPPLFAERSKSFRCVAKYRSPKRQSTCRSLTRKLALTIRNRLCINPVAFNCRIAASISG